MGLLGKATVILNTIVSNPGEEFVFAYPDGAIPEGIAPGLAGIWSQIDNFQKSNPSFHCIVLETPPGNNGKDIVQTAANMISHFGSVCVLPSDDCLVLIPGDMDRELIACQLSKSMNVTILSLYGAESVGGAFETLSAYL
ncbi:MAG: hypothetical protein LBK62_03200 [Treponema sp.]|jgi:hypothetical protein|nr:hypothetical protein [Treponema sp.]